MIEWSDEVFLDFVQLVREESKNGPKIGTGLDGDKAIKDHIMKTKHRLQMIKDASNGDEHARNNILTIMQAREMIHGSQKENDNG